MKALTLIFLSLFFIFTRAAFARDYIDSTPESSVRILDQVVSVHCTYSETSGLKAKIVELNDREGLNPDRMVLVLSDGFEEPQFFELGLFISSVKNIIFLNTDVLVIEYVQDGIGATPSLHSLQQTRTITLEVLRNEDGGLAGQLRTIK